MAISNAHVGLLLRLTAVIEGATALAFLAVPALLVRAMFAQPLVPGVAELGLRFAGAALLAFSIACWLLASDRFGPAALRLVAALLAYNLLAMALLLEGAVVMSMAGVMLWPALAVHTVLAIWCAAALILPRLSRGATVH